MRIEGGKLQLTRVAHMRSAGLAACALALGTALIGTASAASAQSPAVSVMQPGVVQHTGGELYTFYAQRDYRPLWIDRNGNQSDAARLLMELMESAEYDGISPDELAVPALKAALDAAIKTPTTANVTRAELRLSEAFAAYAQRLRSHGPGSTLYEHDNLRPRSPGAYNLLSQAASASSLTDFVREMQWMHPLYGPLRWATTMSSDDRSRAIAVNNLQRIRQIPSARRQVVVDIANARLWMYEHGTPVDSMRVVVGKASTRTPMLAGYIRYAIVNPYWNVPEDLVRKTIASNVLRFGPSYLSQRGYQVLSDWGSDPSLVDARKVNWAAAARGEIDLRVRQLPRPGNAMGRVKFEFPNDYGIYLHDTPEKDLLARDARQFSAGCIRLEDAERLGRWLMDGQALPSADQPETRVDLPRPVPVYLTYLTARAEQGQITLGADPYGLDRPGSPALAARRGMTPQS